VSDVEGFAAQIEVVCGKILCGLRRMPESSSDDKRTLSAARFGNERIRGGGLSENLFSLARAAIGGQQRLAQRV
jgi:hypothetical protein